MVLATLADFLFRGLEMSAPITFCALGAVANAQIISTSIPQAAAGASEKKLIGALDDEDLQHFARFYKNVVHVATPVFDGA